MQLETKAPKQKSDIFTFLQVYFGGLSVPLAVPIIFWKALEKSLSHWLPSLANSWTIREVSEDWQVLKSHVLFGFGLEARNFTALKSYFKCVVMLLTSEVLRS
jgi:hypothetical protein